MNGYELYEFVMNTVVGLSFIYFGMYMTYRYCTKDDKDND